VASSAVDSLEEVMKYLLVGTDVVMTTTALLRHGLKHMTTLVEDLHDGLAPRGIDSVAGIRGRMSLGAFNDPTAFDRVTIFSGGKRPKFRAQISSSSEELARVETLDIGAAAQLGSRSQQCRRSRRHAEADGFAQRQSPVRPRTIPASMLSPSPTGFSP
jgi:hypothetical protein